ncbi:Site-specific recombinase XerD [Pasteurella testudinis DSM 23072]|uniref:Site-specific recombinase XerD n=1 Tax=Pasteurella testudinis DSM 23072 TaxID=1122938 RepID=A0A1W1UMT3_9PAST|nr:site-specific integrase [Pasteurella testudinis]SMB82333.1 Site-specific recombinase XerD [Pasteurella testudinis DSM 23072]SUB52253.1 putative integrase/recombinase [Pasteurella testudinis]
MATFTKIKTGWRCQIRKKGVNKSANFATKAAAQAWANKIESEIATGVYSDIPDLYFTDVIDRYIREVTPSKKGAKQETLRLLRLQKMPIGSIHLRDLSRDHFEQWRNERLAVIKPASVLREWNTLSNIMTYSVEKWNYLKRNPLKAVDKPATPEERTRRYSDDEIERLVFVSQYDFNYLPLTTRSRVAAALLFAFETAMRAGEICNTTWDKINFERRTLFIPQTKNGHARTVPLSSMAMKIINHLALVKKEGDERVFRMTAGTLDSTFRDLKELAGLDDVNLHFHDSRREALSRLAKKVEVMTLAKISGHRDIKILLNTYYAPDMSEVAKSLG